MNKEQATYVVSQSIETLPEKLRRKDIRTYLGEDANSSSSISSYYRNTTINDNNNNNNNNNNLDAKEETAATTTTTTSKCYSTPPSAKTTTTNMNMSSRMSKIDTSMCEKVYLDCVFPTSFWIPIINGRSGNSFHICTSSHPSFMIIDAETSVDIVTIYCLGVKTVRISGGLDSHGTEKYSDFQVEDKFDSVQNIEIPLQMSSRRIKIYISSKTETFSCIFKVTALSTVRSSTLSTPIKGRSPEDASSTVGGFGKIGKSTIITRPMSGRYSKAVVHGSAAVERISKNGTGNPSSQGQEGSSEHRIHNPITSDNNSNSNSANEFELETYGNSKK
jgi:hypothetical protein